MGGASDTSSQGWEETRDLLLRKNSLDTLLKRSIRKKIRGTKIICTMGPACSTVAVLVSMLDRGMSVARFNFSHGTHESHFAQLNTLNAAKRERPDKSIGLLLDTKGPEVRTGLNEGHKVLHFDKGDVFKIYADFNYLGTKKGIGCSYENLSRDVKPGGLIYMGDGNLSVEVISCHEFYVVVMALNEASLGERKNMNLPGVVVDLPCLGEKEKLDIVEFGIKHNFDFVAVSFVQQAQDILDLRQLLMENGSDMQIIAKIENEAGIENFDAINEVADAIMIARGDLGMEIPLEKMFVMQKEFIRRCRNTNKPVITATQMVESMVARPRPTRAEVTDVGNAVLDGTDAVMLSGETAAGEFPIESVFYMSRICCVAEDYMHARQELEHSHEFLKYEPVVNEPSLVKHAWAVASAVAVDPPDAIFIDGREVFSSALARHRVHCPIITTRSRYSLHFGVEIHPNSEKNIPNLAELRAWSTRLGCEVPIDRVLKVREGPDDLYLEWWR